MSRETPHVVRVLSSPGPDIGSNPFVRELIAGLPPEFEVRTFSWLRALFGDVRIVHIHWPEYLIRSRLLPLRLLRVLLLWLLPVWSSWRGVSVIRTVHNLDPHEEVSGLERGALRALDRRSSALVYLTPSTDGLTRDPSLTVIAHPHYGATVGSTDLRSMRTDVKQDLLLFGVIRPYKGVEDLLEAFRDSCWSDAPPTLTIAGLPRSPHYAAALRAAAPAHVRLHLRRLPDDELHRLIARSALVVLPYRRMYNSGAAMLALTCGTAVLVPRSVSMEVLQEEAGADWVHTYEGRLNAATLEAAYAAVVSRPRVAASPGPPLDSRDPCRISGSYAALYRRHSGRSA